MLLYPQNSIRKPKQFPNHYIHLFTPTLSLSPHSSDPMFLVVCVSLTHSHSLTNSYTLMPQYSSHSFPLIALPCQISRFCLCVISPAKSLGSDPFAASRIVFLIQFRPDKQNHANATIFHTHRERERRRGRRERCLQSWCNFQFEALFEKAPHIQLSVLHH